MLAGNTAIGDQALYRNTIGSGNTAVGDSALFSNVGGRNGEGLHAADSASFAFHTATRK